MKMRVLVLFLFLSTCACYAESAEVVSQPAGMQSLTQAQNISFEYCTKMFPVNKEKLFYLTLAAVGANKFSIDEIQTHNGYVIFSAANNKYLATVAGIDANNSILKITPCNDIYFFPPGIILGMFKYIDLNINTEIK